MSHETDKQQTIDSSQSSTILITCSPGLVEYVSMELRKFGYEPGMTHSTGLELQGDLRDAMYLNLHLRTANNVLFLLKHFECNCPDELYRNVAEVPWEQIISPEEYLSVVGKIDTPSIDNTMYASLKVKDAIVDRIAGRTGSRPDSGKDRDNVVIQIYWKAGNCWLYLNTSGRKISDRGYRRMPHKAPLRESLAAAIIMATDYDGSQPLVCPMCGSGTLPIEAALIASRRPAGLLRDNYSFMHVKHFDRDAWQEMRQTALKKSKTRGGKAAFRPAPILATDIDADAVEAARKNAMTAGVDHLIDFDVCDFAATPIPAEPGIIILNPEYGMRMGEKNRLRKTYNRIGDFFKQKCPGYTGYIFTGNLDLAKAVGLRTSRRLPFFNAGIECRLLKYELYAGSRKNRTEP